MIVLAALLTALSGSLTTVSDAKPADNAGAPLPTTWVIADTLPPVTGAAEPGDSLRALLLRVPADTPRARPKAVEVSEWYERRLRIHRYLSYTVIPLFAVQYAAGQQIFEKGSSAPSWAKTTHRAGATALAGVFGVNTVTGLWNLWDSRSVADHRALRVTHSVLMLAADAGFTYAGVKLSKEAETNPDKRREHRTIALASIGVSTLSGLVMYFGNR